MLPGLDLHVSEHDGAAPHAFVSLGAVSLCTWQVAGSHLVSLVFPAASLQAAGWHFDAGAASGVPHVAEHGAGFTLVFTSAAGFFLSFPESAALTNITTTSAIITILPMLKSIFFIM